MTESTPTHVDGRRAAAGDTPGAEAAAIAALKEDLRHFDPVRYGEMVLNISNYGVYLIDRNGLILSWNLGAEIMTGLSAAEVVGRPFDELFTEDGVASGLPQRTLGFARMHQHHRDEQLRRSGSGGSFLAQCSLDVLRADNGELSGFVEVFQDISDQRRREEALYRQATRDALTGISNRGHFLTRSLQEFDHAQRFRDPLSVLMLDIDRFKDVNDTYGHAAGDKVIVQVAEICSGIGRRLDVVGRIGGEEFAITLPRANTEPAMDLARRLRRRIADTPVQHESGLISCTVSIGVASLRPQVRDLHELLRNADAALYQAKREGRNRVISWFE
jgi:diguanylate cyclase (GGDEF)-like protein/PAS domain S-box-containing protein